MAYRALTLALAVATFPQILPAEERAALAGTCPDLGLSSSYLADYFCGQIDGILSGGVTRTINTDDPDLPVGPEFDWLEIPRLQDAYRVDPKKTLDLIQRIRTAGGLPES